MIVHDSLAASGLLLSLRGFFGVVTLLPLSASFLHILALSTCEIWLSVYVSDLFHRFRCSAVLPAIVICLARLAFEVFWGTTRGPLRSLVLLVRGRRFARSTLCEA